MAPLNPTLAISPAAHIAAIVSLRIRRGVSHATPRVCNHVRKPVAAEAPAIAHPTHIDPEYSLIAGSAWVNSLLCKSWLDFIADDGW